MKLRGEKSIAVIEQLGYPMDLEFVLLLSDAYWVTQTRTASRR
jgi:hypothetical protein